VTDAMMAEVRRRIPFHVSVLRGEKMTGARSSNPKIISKITISVT
jgi:hypothetical protein